MSEGISCQRSRMRSVRTPSRDGSRSVCGRHSLPDACAVAFDFIAVFGIIPLGIAVDGACPDASVGVLQRNAPFADPHDELFAPAGTVFDADQEFHGSVCRLVRNRFIQN